MKEVHTLCARDTSPLALLVYNEDGRMDEHTWTCFFHQRRRWCLDTLPCVFDAFFGCSLHIHIGFALPGRVDTRGREYRENGRRMNCMNYTTCMILFKGKAND
jgi:hypothetical protein